MCVSMSGVYSGDRRFEFCVCPSCAAASFVQRTDAAGIGDEDEERGDPIPRDVFHFLAPERDVLSSLTPRLAPTAKSLPRDHVIDSLTSRSSCLSDKPSICRCMSPSSVLHLVS